MLFSPQYIKIHLTYLLMHFALILHLCLPLRDIFGEDCVSVKDGSVLSVTVDGKTANINLETRVRSCSFPCFRTFGKESENKSNLWSYTRLLHFGLYFQFFSLHLLFMLFYVKLHIPAFSFFFFFKLIHFFS